MTNKQEYISARIQGKLKEDFKEKCEKESMSQSEAVRYAIRRWVEDGRVERHT